MYPFLDPGIINMRFYDSNIVHVISYVSQIEVDRRTFIQEWSYESIESVIQIVKMSTGVLKIRPTDPTYRLPPLP